MDLPVSGMCKAILLLAICSTATTQALPSGMEAEDIRVAEHAILANLVIGSSPQGSSICSEKPIVCLTGDSAELAMAVIAARRSPASLHALAELYRYKLEGAYSENLDQYVCEAGRSIEKYLAETGPYKLHERCVRDFNEFVAYASRSANLEGAKVERVCRDAASIRTEVKQSLDMVRNPTKPCGP